MRPVLNDPILEERFQKEGYVKVPFLSEEEVVSLKNAYFDALPESGGLISAEEKNLKEMITYDFTFIDKNIDYKRKVFEIITQAFEKHYKHYLKGYKPIIANFIRKKTETGEVPLHQNWAFIDERKATSVSIWCPLVDGTIENGTLQVVPGTHKRCGEIRGPMIHWELKNLKQPIVANDLIPLETKAGDAVILDDSIVHYSAENHTNELRLAIQLILIPEELPSIHYHMNPEKSPSTVQMLEVDKEFYMKFNPWEKSGNSKVIKTFKYKPYDMTYDDFKKTIYGKRFDEMGYEEKKSFLSKLKAVFS
ncbi:MAG: phytanoyl-CoA dioxygenase family protein [Chitinophagales bacterium]|nr:phytanoyl-CoA dioxygenase family protein [Chitinophagales bacterium]